MLLYLHIPFCHRVCPYCSFYKHTPGNTPIGAFIEALGIEAENRLGTVPAPETLYLGGGTPSMLSIKHLERLFTKLHALVPFSSLKEVTLEANPATFDLEKAKRFLDLGVTRVSLGIQSFSPHVLKTLGREHSPEQASEAVSILRNAGISAVNIDLMFSIPEQSIQDWQETLLHTISLEPDHISAYNLTYEEDTAFFETLKNGTYQENQDDDADHYHLAEELLSSAGFLHYETSNYAKPGFESIHNQGYWQGMDYLGLGPSSVSTIQGTRHQNISDTHAYIRQVQSLGNALSSSEVLLADHRRIELIALGLRTSRGIPLTLLELPALERAKQLEEENLLHFSGDRLVLSKLGRPLVDPIALELIE